MAVNIKNLTSALVKAFTETKEVTSYDSETGREKKETQTFSPDEDKMKKLAREVLDHITNNAEVYSVATNVTTTVSTTVAPGIPVVTPAGPGTTSGPGAGTGNGTGNGSQTGSGKIK